MLKIYNTQSRKKEEFKPVRPGKVSMYVCGPTVYNRIHIGNARTFIVFDIIRRYLIWSGYDVKFVQNITDVDDKIINKAIAENCNASDVAAKFSELFIQDMHAANVMDPDVRPFATKEIGAMIGLVKKLVDSGHAYVVEGDVYFDVSSFKGYGSLSGRDVEDAQSGHRDLAADGQGLESRKRNSADFALWKAAKPGEPSWNSPWGEGRPGWHIECSAMSHKYLGLPFDIHGGGSDLVFPHHENERAQSMCGYKSDFANYWLHCGMLQIVNDTTGENEKMSKSLNNFIMLHDALDNYSANTLRLLVLQTHYRSPLVFSKKRVDAANSALDRIINAIKKLDYMSKDSVSWGSMSRDSELQGSVSQDSMSQGSMLQDSGSHGSMSQDSASQNSVPKDSESQVFVSKGSGPQVSAPKDSSDFTIKNLVDNTKKSFIESMDDDFNTSKAIGEVFALISHINSAKAIGKDDCLYAKETILDLLKVFGISIELQKSLPVEILEIAKDVADFNADGVCSKNPADFASGRVSSDSDSEILQSAAEAILKARSYARKNKDWDKADAIRDKLAEIDLSVEDTPHGSHIV